VFFGNPQVGHVAATAPCVPGDTRDNCSRIILLNGAERLAVKVPGRPRIELVDALRKQNLEFLAVAATKLDGWECHAGIRRAALTIATER